MASGQFVSDGFALRYVEEGDGPPLLIVGSATYYPRTFSPELRSHRRLIFIDHRGFARCDRPVSVEDAALDRVVMDIERLRNHLGLEQVDVLGHSGNSYLALEYARRYPRRTRRVVAISIGPSFAPAHMDPLEQLWSELVAPERKAIFDRDMAELPAELAAKPADSFITYCIRMGARSWFDPAYDARALWRDVHVNGTLFDKLWGETFRDHDMHALLKGIAAPILLALGRFDYIIAPPSTWNDYRASAQSLMVRYFEKSAHSPQQEESALFDRVLLDFLNSA